MADWPKHQDGRPMKMGEMTPEQQREQWEAAAARVQADFERPEVKEAMRKALA